jgi:hypothetical protein
MGVPASICMFLNVTPCSLVFADVLEECAASILKVEENDKEAKKQSGL